jgi:hypothetical protein
LPRNPLSAKDFTPVIREPPSGEVVFFLFNKIYFLKSLKIK